MSFLKIALGFIAGGLEKEGERSAEAILQDLHDSNIEDYKACIFGFNAGLKHLLPLVQKSPNNIDDAFFQAIDTAIRKSAANNNITLDA